MAPQRKKSGKKKRPNKDRSEKISSCEGCSIKLDKRNFVYCECTQVRFCSEVCKEDHPHKDCSGRPQMNTDVMGRLGDRMPVAAQMLSGSDQYQETVQQPTNRYVVKKIPQMGDPRKFTVWDYAKMADEGETLEHQACAYMTAVKFKHRMLGAPRLQGGTIMNDNSDVNIPVLESQDLAFQYFEKAAKLGHGWSMKSLGECFDQGIGCRKNRRRSLQWIWRACLNHTDGAIEMMDAHALLRKELNANIMQIDGMMQRIPPGTRSIGVLGPNIGSLLLAFYDVVENENFSLPPFAGTWATATVNNTPVNREIQGAPRIPLVGSGMIKTLVNKIHSLEARGTTVQVGYGRRGTGKQATAMSLASSHSSRAIDNQLFFMPPRAACDERVTDEELEDWRMKLLYQPDKANYRRNPSLPPALYPLCVHNEHDRKHAHLYCRECEAEAKLRLEAVSCGSVVLSVDESLDQRGQAAIYRSPDDGSLKIETWKNYGVGEAECVLAILAASGISAYVAPIFIAQDPNLYWPLIADHGCIRAALEFVAPHIDWDARISSVKDPIISDCQPIISDCQPGQCLHKCGHNLCTNLEAYKAKKFRVCSGCDRRRYCSETCQKDDWRAGHKHECRKTVETNPRINEPETVEEDAKLSVKYSFDLKEGEDAVIHGLKAKPQYNGLVGVVGEAGDNGRLAVRLRSSEGSKPISIKPENMYHIGVFCRKRKKKPRVFECVHGLEVCSECYLDFTTVNILCRLKYSGNDVAGSFVADGVNESHFASFVLDKGEEWAT
ncbi:hypothetical protein ACHAXR_004548 [Thalassiosira sp. AJA248-18]